MVIIDVLIDEPVCLEPGKRLRGKSVIKKGDLLTVVASGKIVNEIVGVKVERFQIFRSELGNLGCVELVGVRESRCFRRCGVGRGWPGLTWWSWG